jgi:hypothetical protein
MNIGGEHMIVRSEAPVPRGEHRLGVRVRRLAKEVPLIMSSGPGISEFTLLIDGMPSGRIQSRFAPHPKTPKSPGGTPPGWLEQAVKFVRVASTRGIDSAADVLVLHTGEEGNADLLVLPPFY